MLQLNNSSYQKWRLEDDVECSSLILEAEMQNKQQFLKCNLT